MTLKTWFATWLDRLRSGNKRPRKECRAPRRCGQGLLTCEALESRLAPALASAAALPSNVSPQLNELYQEFLPYKAAGAVSSFVPSNDLEALNVARGAVAVNVLAFTNTKAELVKLGAHVIDVRYLPVAYGMPGIETQAMLPIAQLPAAGALAGVLVSADPRTITGNNTPPGIATQPKSETVVAGNKAKF